VSIRLSTTARSAAADAVVDLIDAGAAAGTLKIYSGSVGTTANDTPAGTLLATVAWADPAFGAASSGVATATDPASVNASATGTAGCFLVEDSNGNNVFDGTVTATGGGGDLTLSSTSLVSGSPVDITSFTYTA
jgi:hypothetical protein